MNPPGFPGAAIVQPSFKSALFLIYTGLAFFCLPASSTGKAARFRVHHSALCIVICSTVATQPVEHSWIETPFSRSLDVFVLIIKGL